MTFSANAVPVKPFWMVVGKGPTSVRHNDEDLAVHEAERLARQNPNEVFYVTKSTRCFVTPTCFEIPVADDVSTRPPF